MKRYAAVAALGGMALAARGAEIDQAVEELIPKLADPEVGNRYDAQMALQDIASKASTPGHEAERRAMGILLAAKATDPSVPQPARVWIVRQLQYMGRAEAVKALGELLNDEDAELRECARRALEENPARTARGQLRTALRKANDPNWKIGLINSLGMRGDARSVKLIAGALDDSKTACAAALALGKIANGAAVEALWTAFNKTPEAGEALIVAAMKMEADDKAAAKKIYERIAGEADSKYQKKAAQTGLERLA